MWCVCTCSRSSCEDGHHPRPVQTLLRSQAVVLLQDEVQQALRQSRRQRLSLHLLQEERCHF